MPPSVTLSSRFFIAIGVTEVIGSTPSTFTSCNCSTNARMELSSPRRCSTSSSATAMRASLAMRRTVAASTDMARSRMAARAIAERPGPRLQQPQFPQFATHRFRHGSRAGRDAIKVARRVLDLKIAPALERPPRARLDQDDLGLKHQPAAADALPVHERTYRQQPLPAQHLAADHPVERPTARQRLGLLGNHARGVDVLGLLAAGAPTLLDDPIFEVLHRVAADAKLDEMKHHACSICHVQWGGNQRRARTGAADAGLILREGYWVPPRAALRSIGGGADCGGGAACVGRLGGAWVRLAAGAAAPVVSPSAGSVVMMQTAGIESDDGKNTLGPTTWGAAYAAAADGSDGTEASEGGAGTPATGGGAIAGHTVAWRWT